MNRGIFWLSILLIALAGLSTALMVHFAPHPHLKKLDKKALSAYMQNTTYTQYNKNGLIDAEVNSPYISHYNHQNSTYFRDPHMLMYTSKRIPWHISAKHGRSQFGSTEVYLWDHVKLHQPTTEEQPETTILTESSTVYPKKSIAKTRKPVTLIRPHSITKGTGLTANLKTGVVQLLSQSRGVYVPEHSTKK